MRKFLPLLVLLTLLISSARAATLRPNIIIILADDMGYSDIGCYGSEIATPNLDHLASQGIRFTQFYNNARCCPSRATILTGLYPHQAGVGHMNGDYKKPGYIGHLNDSCVTLAEVLHTAGYQTMMSGKWHVGLEHPNRPLDRGFENYFGIIHGGGSYFEIGGKLPLRDGDEPVPTPPGFYLTEALTDRAVKDIDQATKSDKPFFLYLAYTAPHWPLHALPEDIAKYRDKYLDGWDELRLRRHKKMIELGIVDSQWPLSPRDPKAPAWADAKLKERESLKMAIYAAQVDRLDQCIGRVLGKLHDTKIEDNTVVLFLSDNGGNYEEIHKGQPGSVLGTKESFASYGRPWGNASNTPFRLFKHYIHEGGISTPLIARWPGQIKPGTMTQQIGHITDIMPTLVEIAGATYPETFKDKPVTPIKGVSLLPALRGENVSHPPIFWEHEGNRAVRDGDWKLVAVNTGQWELYDIKTDRTELHDLAKDHPEIVAKMTQQWDIWASKDNVEEFDELRKTVGARE